MDLVKNPISIFAVLLILSFPFPSSQATQIEILNRCSYTVWAAADPGGGKQLNPGEKWTLTNLTGSGRIWGRTNCAFDSEGRGKCESGDCSGHLDCRTKGRAPNTVAQYAINRAGSDLINISVVEGFNIPMDFSPASEGLCRGASKCAADVNEACPMELRDPGGCNNPCTVFANSQFCCTPGTICESTTYSKLFKDLCPYASTYPSDGQGSVCPTGQTDYTLVFCPSNNESILNTAFFEIENSCSYTVWAAAIPGGGKRLDPKQKWLMSINMASIERGGNRIWGRTNCNFDKTGRGKCETGDCGGVLECKNSGDPPSTLAEYTLNLNKLDYFDISLVDGFNIPMEIGPARSESKCSQGISCARDVNGDCPNELRVPGGCNNACTAFKTDQYCCAGANSTRTTCGPTVFSLFFKDRCPGAYSYPYDDETAKFVCPSGNSYQVVFCP